MPTPFNKIHVVGDELKNIQESISNSHLSGDGAFTKKCHAWLEKNTGTYKALLTHSCTAALEMASILADVSPGDEVILPSYTFVSTANAFVLRGAVPVFVDIRPDTLNLDEKLIEQAITPKTRAIVPVHYAGVACEMDTIMAIAKRHDLLVIEDAAQGVMSTYKGRTLGTIGQLGAYSFHETKNVISGEGGALLINDHRYTERAEVIREKGTNRSQFFRGEVDKYTWVDVGSSFLPSELIAAFLWPQLEKSRSITDSRLAIWGAYHKGFEQLEKAEKLRRPIIPEICEHNAHMYYILLSSLEERTALIEHLRKKDIRSVFHYVPLHSAPAGKKYGRTAGELVVTDKVSETLLRLPMFVGLDTTKVISSVHEFFQKS